MLKFVQLGLIALVLACTALPVDAQAISPTMLEQIKKLPRAEQEKIAKQYGLDLSKIGISTAANGTSLSSSTTPLLPRHLQQQANESSEQQVEKLPEPDDGKPKRFGMNLFNEKISTFAPVNTMPVPDGYILGPDDSIQLQLYGKQNSEYNLKVSREGYIAIPDLAPINVTGMTFSTVSELIRQRIAQTMIGTNAAVSMGALRTINVFIAGEAKNPGMYAVSALSSVTQALFVAGGVSDIGSLRNIVVKRNGNEIARFDLYQLLLNGDNSGDVNLQHGDVVFVAPMRGEVEAQGEVLRPALYEILANETIADLVTMSGGLKPSAYAKAAILERIDLNNVRTIETLDLSQAADNGKLLKTGDVLRLNSISARVENHITVAGAVVRPGKYAYKPAMRVTDIINNIWSDLLLTADLDYALVVREVDSKGNIDVFQFDLAEALNGNVSHNINLSPRDTLLVFHHANQSYKRDVLNNFFRGQLSDIMLDLQDMPELAGDIAKRSFDALNDENRLLELNNVDVITPDPLAEPLIPELNVEELSQDLFVRFITNVLTDPEYLQLTPHLTRSELLFPVLQRLKQQGSNQIDIKVVSVSGDVKAPGEYPLTKNASATALIKAAGGLTASSYLARAELSRYNNLDSYAGQVNVEHLTLNLAEIMSGKVADLPLQSRDRLNVFSTPRWAEARKVSIEGEVRFPGEYTILQGETLKDLIQRAGGFTSDAFVFGAVFTREQVRLREQEQMVRLLEQLKADVATRALSAQPSSTSSSDALRMVRELGKIEPVGRLVIDAEQIQAGNPEYNIALEDGDRLVVPRRNYSVSIIGEVQVAGTHRFDPTLDVDEYLGLAGGTRKRADEDRVYVIRADGSVLIPTKGWFSGGNTNLKPGDTIVVPVDTEYKDDLSLWAQVTQIFYQSAVAIAAITRI